MGFARLCEWRRKDETFCEIENLLDIFGLKSMKRQRTYVKVAFEICFTMSQLINLEEWFNVCDLNVRFVWIKSGHIDSIRIFDNVDIFDTESITIEILKNIQNSMLLKITLKNRSTYL